MSHLTSVKTPKKKRRLLKPQKNTLDQYFRAPERSLQHKRLCAGGNQETEQSLVKTAEVDVKIDESCQKKMLTKKGTSCSGQITKKGTSRSGQMIDQARVLLEKVSVSDAKKVLNGKCKSRGTTSETSNCKEKTVISEIKSDKRYHQSFQKENERLELISPLKRGRISPENSVNRRITMLVNEALNQLNPSINDSVHIDIVSPQKKAKTSHAVECEHNSLLPIDEAKVFKFPDELSNTRTSQSESTHVNCPIDKITLPPREKRMVSAISFKEIVYCFCHDDFSKPYRKLNSSKVPECCDVEKCRAIHGDTRPKEVTSYHYGHLFNILDCPLSEWLCDILPAMSLVLTRGQYLRGDMLRVMFDYILNGPNEDLMWDIKTVLETHWSLHPPCTDHMRTLYLQLLDSHYPYESFFKTDLTNSGVLLHILDQMEKVLKLKTDTEEICENKTNDEDQNSNSRLSKLTFEMLEERFNNRQSLFGEEERQLDLTSDEFAVSSQLEKDASVLDNSAILKRLTVALEVIVDLLEADFMICVSRLKAYLKEECELREPLIKHLIDDSFQLRVLKFYVNTTNTSTWKQLSRLIGLVAESVHLFKHGCGVRSVWLYPNINADCEEFASVVFKEFSKGGWDDSERLSRLQNLRPPWLQQRVTLAVANSQLNLDLGSGIQAMVDIIHTHVISPVKLENDLEKIEPDPDNLRISKKLMQKSKKKNQYGESLLHEMCRSTKFTTEDVEGVLALSETDVNARDNYGWTALHEAVNRRHLAKIKLLLQYQPPPGSGKQEVDVGAQNNDGITPLHEAVEADSLEICHLLVQYGGICLLRKKDNGGVTPLKLARDRKEIGEYFEKMIKIQEELNLNSNSILKLPDTMIRMCMVVCEAFIADHHTWELYQVLKYNKPYMRASPEPWVAASSKEILLQFKQDQDHFRKLRRILEKLAENPDNSYLIRLWNDRFLFREKMNLDQDYHK